MNKQEIKRVQEIFEQIVKEAQTDPNILAFWLDGSRGKGIIEHAESDYDCMMLVVPEKRDEYKNRYEKIGNPLLELGVMTLDEFINFAAWGSEMAWYRYNYVALKPPLVDKTGRIEELFEGKAGIPESERKKFISEALDYYINEVYRSLKCFRDGQIVGARLEAAESITPLLDTVFALHGRLRPYYKYFDWELKNRPLAKLNISGEELRGHILTILDSADIKAQQKLLNEIEIATRKDGYGAIWDSWLDKIDWMKNFVL